jgi:hypothetical protein
MTKELLKYSKNGFDLFYSKDMEEDELTSEIALDIISDEIETYFYSELDSKQKKLIDFNAKKNKLEKIASLYAHGDSVDETWHYVNGLKSFPLQEWINELDGKYKLIILSTCNPGRHEIYSEKSCILATNENYNKSKLEMGDVQMELYVPGIGYINSYTIDSELKNLEKIKKNYSY